jgi:hypothetical protein
MTTEDFKKISDTVPKDPGVYRFINDDDIKLNFTLLVEVEALYGVIQGVD